MTTPITLVGVFACLTWMNLGCDRANENARPVALPVTDDLVETPVVSNYLPVAIGIYTNHAMQTLAPPQHDNLKILTVTADTNVDYRIRAIDPEHTVPIETSDVN